MPKAEFVEGEKSTVRTCSIDCEQFIVRPPWLQVGRDLSCANGFPLPSCANDYSNDSLKNAFETN
jgi:hypothetical protein